ATAHVEKALTRLQPQLAADQFQLLLLSFIERVVGPLEIGARVDQRRPQPRAEELDGLIVVISDGITVAPLGVPRTMAESLRQAGGSPQHGLQQPLAQGCRVGKKMFRRRENTEQI